MQFLTVYPGWYPGRTPHIHVEVHVASGAPLVSPLYAPEGKSHRAAVQLARAADDLRGFRRVLGSHTGEREIAYAERTMLDAAAAETLTLVGMLHEALR